MNIRPFYRFPEALHITLALMRKNSGYSLTEVGEALKVTRQMVNRWETGAALSPSYTQFIKLCELYDEDPFEFISKTDPIFLFVKKMAKELALSQVNELLATKKVIIEGKEFLLQMIG